MFSQRSAIARELNRLTIALERRRNAGLRIIDLSVSNPTQVGVDYDRLAIVDAFINAQTLRYEPEPLGLPVAREAVAAHYRELGVELGSERVVVTASTSEAYSLLFKLLCDPGDEILTPRPSYPLLEHLARFDHVRAVPYQLAYDGSWYLDFDSVERARTQRTRAILVVSPNNPTGSYLKRDELSQLSRLGLPVISDEVFASYPLTEDPRRVRTALEMDAVLVFALGGLSKLAALPQFKLGWIGVGGPKALVEEALGRIELIADAYLTAAPPLQLALPALMDSRGVAHAAISARLKNNLEQLRSCLGPSAAVPLPVQGGWYAVLRLPAVLDEESWAIRLIERDGVCAHPGFFYDFAQEPFLVLSLLTPPEQFVLGVERIRRRVAHPDIA
jgi:hypothetical protein